MTYGKRSQSRNRTIKVQPVMMETENLPPTDLVVVFDYG